MLDSAIKVSTSKKDILNRETKQIMEKEIVGLSRTLDKWTRDIQVKEEGHVDLKQKENIFYYDQVLETHRKFFIIFGFAFFTLIIVLVFVECGCIMQYANLDAKAKGNGNPKKNNFSIFKKKWGVGLSTHASGNRAVKSTRLV